VLLAALDGEDIDDAVALYACAMIVAGRPHTTARGSRAPRRSRTHTGSPSFGTGQSASARNCLL
jgi:hypothetical protein